MSQNKQPYNSSPDTLHDTSIDPFEILSLEQREELKYVTLMENAMGSIKTNGFSVDAFEQIAKGIRYVATKVRARHEREEKFCLPAIERHRADLPAVVRKEHRELWKAFSHLLEVVKDVEDGKIYGTITSELHQLVSQVVELLRNSITKENSTVFPTAKKMMTIKEYNLFQKEFSNSFSERMSVTPSKKEKK